MTEQVLTNPISMQASAPAADAPPKKKTRIAWIDILRGFMMLFVIYGHTTDNGLVLTYIYSFHMPIYFVISGMTFRFNKVWDTAQYTWNKFVGLMIPYFLLNLYVAPLRLWMEDLQVTNDQSLTDLFLGVLYSNADCGLKMSSNTTWFIPCLFLTTMMFFFLRKMFSRDRDLIWAVVVVTVAFALLGQARGTGGFWHWKSAVMALVFYLAGYLFMEHVSEVQEWVEKLRWKLLVPIVVLAFAGYWLSKINGYVSMIHNQYENLILYYASALASCAAVILIFMMLSRSALFLKLAKPVDFVGRKTLPYIAFQVPVMKLFRYAFPVLRDNYQLNIFLFSLALYIGLMPVAAVVDRLIPKKIPMPGKG